MRGVKGAFAVVLLAVLACAAGGPPVLSAEQRIALVIGNSAYPDMPLTNPVNDAKLMASALREQGFELLASLIAEERALVVVQDGADLPAEAFRDLVAPILFQGRRECVTYLLGRERLVGGTLCEALPATPHIQTSVRAIAHLESPMSDRMAKNADNVKFTPIFKIPRLPRAAPSPFP